MPLGFEDTDERGGRAVNELTYDPVLNSRPVSKWRLGSPLRPPGPGRALVLVQESGTALTVRSGDEIPSARFGAYQGVFTVDLTEHRLLLDVEPLLSRDPTFSFRSRVDLVCRVIDPAEVVRRGIRDMSGALYGHLRRMLREVSRDYDIAEFHEAETALNAVLREFSGDAAVRLSNIRLELLVDEDEIVTSGREYRDVVRETRLDRMRRQRHLSALKAEGEAGLVAEIMEREGPRAALAWMEKRKADERSARLAAAELVLKRGDADREPFEQAELERAVVSDLTDDGDLFGEDTGRSRLRGALAAGDPVERDRDRREAFDGEDEVVGSGPDVGGSDLRGETARPHLADEWRWSRRPASLHRDGTAGAGATLPGEPPDDEPLPSSGRGWVGAEAEVSARDEGGGRPADRLSGRDTGEGGAPSPRRTSRVRGTAKQRSGSNDEQS
jgi:hypothetical protein